LVFAGAWARADEPAGWGTVKGQIVWGGGDLPTPKPVEAVKTHQDRAACEAKGPVVSEEWVINKENNGIRWAFVWLAPEGNGKLPIHPSLVELKEKEVSIDQPCCQFEPRVVGVRQGQVLVVKNSAPIVHNVFWNGGIKNPGNNLIIPAKGQPVIIKNLNPDKFPIKLECSIHRWMTGWVRVFDHPYFAVTDADGKFEIPQAPAGKYRLVVWHEGCGWGPTGREGRPIDIKKDGTTEIEKLELRP
jgi:hypothetical protein